MPDFLNSSLGLRLTIGETVQEIVSFMRAEPTRHYQVTIGTDSELLAEKNADFLPNLIDENQNNIGFGNRSG